VQVKYHQNLILKVVLSNCSFKGETRARHTRLLPLAVPYLWPCDHLLFFLFFDREDSELSATTLQQPTPPATRAWSMTLQLSKWKQAHHVSFESTVTSAGEANSVMVTTSPCVTADSNSSAVVFDKAVKILLLNFITAVFYRAFYVCRLDLCVCFVFWNSDCLDFRGRFPKIVNSI